MSISKMKTVALTAVVAFASSFLVIGPSVASEDDYDLTCPYGGSPNWLGVCDVTTEAGDSYFGPPIRVPRSKPEPEPTPSPVPDSTPESAPSKPSTPNPEAADDDYVLTCPYGGSPNWLGVCDVTTEAGDSYFGPPIRAPKPAPSPPSVTSPSGSIDGGSSSPVAIPDSVKENPHVAHGYAAVDANGNVVNIMVCSYDVCGKDDTWLNLAISQGVLPPGTRLILQTLRNEETGNVAGYMNSRFDAKRNSFVTTREGDGSVWEIPVAYPGSKELTCVENCAPLLDEEPVLLKGQTLKSFITALAANTRVTVVGSSAGKTRTWRAVVRDGGKVNFVVPEKFSNWRFRVVSKKI